MAAHTKDVEQKDRLLYLIAKGFSPKVIYDIGAGDASWTREIRCIFPTTQFYLFEANEKETENLKKLKFPYFIELLGDEDKVTKYLSFRESNNKISLFNEQSL